MFFLHLPARGRVRNWGWGGMSDNFTYLSVIGRISLRGEGAWRRLQTRTRVQVHQWAANYFLVRMVVPGTKPVENPCPTTCEALLGNLNRYIVRCKGVFI